MLNIIKGRGAFRRFKENISNYNFDHQLQVETEKGKKKNLCFPGMPI